MEDEKWKRIPGYIEYEVSDKGRVRYNYKLMIYILSLHNDANGYTTVRLNKRNLRVRSRVDLIVLSAFSGQKPKNAEIVHENGDKYDNRLENLYWTAKK
jgi:hypothetical protein